MKKEQVKGEKGSTDRFPQSKKAIKKTFSPNKKTSKQRNMNVKKIIYCIKMFEKHAFHDSMATVLIFLERGFFVFLVSKMP